MIMMIMILINMMMILIKIIKVIIINPLIKKNTKINIKKNKFLKIKIRIINNKNINKIAHNKALSKIINKNKI